MIIQCKQCRTKFRFDDAQIVDDGIWMRCSRCQHVFFQDNPMKMSRTGTSPVPPVSSAEDVSGSAAKRLSFEPAVAVVSRNDPGEDAGVVSSQITVRGKNTSDGLKIKSQPADKEDAIFADIDFSPGAENLDEPDESSGVFEEEKPAPVRKKNRIWMVALWSLLVIVVIPSIVLYFAVPQWGEIYMNLGKSGVNAVFKVIGVSPLAESRPVTAQVKLQDIRQRFLDNYILGHIRIVEGFAVNHANYPIARVLLKGTILDAYAVIKGERVIYAGNVLTDEELANMSEEEIAQRLALPSGRDNLNERIIPNGRIPFMIVFTNEPPGAIKTMVKVVGAERLL
jgi:predicted Zn finger-like uncharacterized protein